MSTRSKRHGSRASPGDIRPFDGMRQINPPAAGIDLGAHDILAGVPDGDEQPRVRAFGPSPAALDAVADWVVARGIQPGALESTGVYWMPLFETLAAHGLRCCLSRASSLPPVPGRKSDVLDCQWMQTLHSDGVLAASWRPDADLVALRTLWRHRAQLLAPRAPHVLHRPKALVQMHLQFSQALSDVTGPTGWRILRAIGAGERDPPTLAAWRNSRGKKEAHEMARA